MHRRRARSKTSWASSADAHGARQRRRPRQQARRHRRWQRQKRRATPRRRQERCHSIAVAVSLASGGSGRGVGRRDCDREGTPFLILLPCLAHLAIAVLGSGVHCTGHASSATIVLTSREKPMTHRESRASGDDASRERRLGKHERLESILCTADSVCRVSQSARVTVGVLCGATRLGSQFVRGR